MSRWALTGVCGVIAITLAAGPAANAQNDTGTVDLIGRNGQFVVKERNGSVQEIDGRDLELNRLVSRPPSRTPEVPVIRPADNAEQENAESAPAPTESADDAGAADATSKAKAEQEAARKAEVRAQDVEMLRKLYHQGGAYFYTKDDKPISNEEIVRRMETGDVAEIKVIGLHLQELETRTEPDEDAKTKKNTGKPAAATKPKATPKRSTY